MTALTTARARIGGGLGAGFWRLWSAALVANLADGVFQIALPLLAISLTDSPALVAGITLAHRLPWLLFALVAGALADRLDRRRTMLLVQVTRALLAGGLAAAAVGGFVSIWLLYLVALAIGVLETLFDTAAQSIVPNVVSRDRLESANGRLLAAEMTMNQFVGPPLGGFLVAVGIGVAFGSAAAGFLGAALLLGGLAGSFRPDRAGPPTQIHEEIGEGIRFLAGHGLLRTLAVVIALLNVANGAVTALLVLYAVEPGPMGLDEVGFGLLLTANAVGTIVGVVAAAAIERAIGRPNILLAGIVMLLVTDLALVFTTNALLIGATFVVGGVFFGAFNVTYQSLRQRIVPDRILGRVVATFRMLGWGALPLGALLGGLIGEAFGLVTVFASAAVLTALMLPARLLITDARIRDAETRAAVEASAAGR